MIEPCFVLDNMLSQIVNMLHVAHESNSSQEDLSIKPYTLFWLWVDQYLLLILNAECLAEKQQIPILMCLVWLGQGSNPRPFQIRG